MFYCQAVEPGFPPFGWKDITPYFGGIPSSLNNWRKSICKKYGWLLAIQTVKQGGQKYRRVAVALDPESPVNRKAKDEL